MTLSSPGNLRSNLNGVVLYHDRLRPDLPFTVQLIETPPNGVANQVTYPILGYPSHTDARSLRYIRPVRSAAGLLYNVTKYSLCAISTLRVALLQSGLFKDRIERTGLSVGVWTSSQHYYATLGGVRHHPLAP